MNKSFTLLFRVKTEKQLANGLAPIYLRLTVDSERVEIATKRGVIPEKWNHTAQKMIDTTEEARSLNSYLKSLEQQVFQAHREMMGDGLPITATSLKQKLYGNNKEAVSLIKVFEAHNSDMKKLVGKQYAEATVKRYETALRHLRSFIKRNYGQDDILIMHVDHAFVTAFDFYLREDRSCNNNSTFKYVKNLKKIVGVCLANGWLTKDPFSKYKIRIKEVERQVLTESDLNSMHKKDFKNERLSATRDIFLFCCYTGLSYVDVKNLKRIMISVGIDGNRWIFTRRQKSKEATRVPLLPEAQKIVDKYKTHPKCLNEDVALPVLSNQKMNCYLKEIADLCGIEKLLTNHIARHTFATTVTLGNGVPIESVSKMLGHRNIRTTQHYAKILDQKVSYDMLQLKDRLAVKSEIADSEVVQAKSKSRGSKTQSAE